MDQNTINFLMLAGFFAGLALYGNHICHPARNRLQAVLCFTLGIILTPAAAAGVAFLLYRYHNDIGVIWALFIFGVLSWGGYWFLRRTIRRPPRRSRKAGSGTVEAQTPEPLDNWETQAEADSILKCSQNTSRRSGRYPLSGGASA